MQADQSFTRLYANGARQGAIKAIDLHVEAIPRRVQVELETARLDSGNIVHAGDTVVVEATVRPWQQPARNIRIPIKLPPGLAAGNLRLLVSDAGTLDRALNQPRISTRTVDLDTALAAGAKSAPRRPHLCQPPAARNPSRRQRPDALQPCRFPWPTPLSPCAPPRM